MPATVQNTGNSMMNEKHACLYRVQNLEQKRTAEGNYVQSDGDDNRSEF